MAPSDPSQLQFLKTTWNQLCSSYSDDITLKNKLFEQICREYGNSSRYYHNLNHISAMLTLADEHNDLIRHRDIVLFSIWFHDLVYDSLKKDNEEKSADMAEEMLTSLAIGKEAVQKIRKFIIATKSHSDHSEPDLCFFLDLDLSVLGSDSETYSTYCKNVRKEYKWVPGILYKKGRKKVLQHFLDMERIFKTDRFYELFEVKARKNIKRELAS
ncbi:MAG: hypothetical protein ACJ75J_14345 [Cytophagaceae bacterium]